MRKENDEVILGENKLQVIRRNVLFIFGKTHDHKNTTFLQIGI